MTSNIKIQTKFLEEKERLAEKSTFIKQNVKTLMNVLDAKLVELYKEPCTANLPSPQDFTKAIESTLSCVFCSKNDIKKELKHDMNMMYDMPIKNRKLHSERLLLYRNKVANAANNKHIFSICGKQTQISKSLKARGWIEKYTQKQLSSLKMIPQNALLMFAAPGNNFENMILSKLAQMYPTNFQWLYLNNTETDSTPLKYDLPYRNRIKYIGTSYFTNKDGLIDCVVKSNLNITKESNKVQVPRLYRLRNNNENIVFFKEYRVTYCLSLLKFINNENDIRNLFSNSGTIPLSIIVFAIEKLRYAINIYENPNIPIDDDKLLGEDVLWEYFYKCTESLINRKDLLKISDKKHSGKCIQNIKELIEQSTKYWPYTISDGYYNLWIVKPSNACQGRGIFITNSYVDIMKSVNSNINRNYIVQKYIERPLLIYNTKFDIRQYMLVTTTYNKFNIWMYKDCYLRFSSQEFSLTNLDRAIHITNNAVQKNLKNGLRNNKLPQNNMWQLEQFKEYLKVNNKQYTIWPDQIYIEMKKICIKIVLSCLESIQYVPKSFELYGCDFIIDEYFKPHLIEINASPDLSHSTTVTAKICPAVLEDIIKVVIDLPNNPNIDIGKFELIHSFNWKELRIGKNYMD